MRGFSRDLASPLLRALMKLDERWEPYAARGAHIIRPDGRTRVAHQHQCLMCEATAGWGDDCQLETPEPHDVALCWSCRQP